MNDLYEYLDMFWRLLPFTVGYLVMSFTVGCLGGWRGETYARKKVKAREAAVLRREQYITLQEYQIREFKEGLAAERAKARRMAAEMEDDTLPGTWMLTAEGLDASHADIRRRGFEPLPLADGITVEDSAA